MSSFKKIVSEKDILELFTEPFVPQKILFTKNSDFFKAGNEACGIYDKQIVTCIDDEKFLHNEVEEFICNEKGCNLKFKTVYEYELHYRSLHINYCSECKKTFSTDQLLQHHIEEAHDTFLKAAAEKYQNVYHCTITDCEESFPSLSDRSEHLLKIHSMKTEKSKCVASEDKMDVSESSTSAQQKKTVASRVPKSICFGRHSTRSFSQPKSKKKSKAKETDITMKELEDALN